LSLDQIVNLSPFLDADSPHKADLQVHAKVAITSVSAAKEAVMLVKVGEERAAEIAQNVTLLVSIIRRRVGSGSEPPIKKFQEVEFESCGPCSVPCAPTSATNEDVSNDGVEEAEVDCGHVIAPVQASTTDLGLIQSDDGKLLEKVNPIEVAFPISPAASAPGSRGSICGRVIPPPRSSDRKKRLGGWLPAGPSDEGSRGSLSTCLAANGISGYSGGKAIVPAITSACSTSTTDVASALESASASTFTADSGFIRQITNDSLASGTSREFNFQLTDDRTGTSSGSMAPAELGLLRLTKNNLKRCQTSRCASPPICRAHGTAPSRRWKSQLPITIEAVRDARSLFYRGEGNLHSGDEDHDKHVQKLYFRLATDPTRPMTASFEQRISSKGYAFKDGLDVH
jgi:hypothetical protein